MHMKEGKIGSRLKKTFSLKMNQDEENPLFLVLKTRKTSVALVEHWWVEDP